MRIVVYLWHLFYVHVIWKKMTIKYSVKIYLLSIRNI